jgi:hypothetical protein
LKYPESLWLRNIENISNRILKYDVVGVQEVRTKGGSGTEAVSDLQLSVGTGKQILFTDRRLI